MLISKFPNNDIMENIADMETEYGIKLPDQYKAFLYKYNGGYTPKTTLNAKKIKTDITGFYGFTDKNNNLSFSNVLRCGFGEELIDKLLLPIATNSFGDYIVMNVSEKKCGEIFFVYHDKPQKEIIVSSDFNNFILLCKSEKIGQIRTIDERKQCLIEAGKGDKITEKKIECWQREIDKYANINQEEVKLD